MHLPKCVVLLKSFGEKKFCKLLDPQMLELFHQFILLPYWKKKKKNKKLKYPEFEVFLNESTSYWKHWSDEKLVQALKAVTNSYIHFHV